MCCQPRLGRGRASIRLRVAGIVLRSGSKGRQTCVEIRRRDARYPDGAIALEGWGDADCRGEPNQIIRLSPLGGVPCEFALHNRQGGH